MKRTHDSIEELPAKAPRLTEDSYPHPSQHDGIILSNDKLISEQEGNIPVSETQLASQEPESLSECQKDPDTEPPSPQTGRDENVNAEDIGKSAVQVLLQEAVESLSDMSRVLELWDAGLSLENNDESKLEKSLQKRKSRITDSCRRYFKKLKKLSSIIPTSGLGNSNMPMALIKHIDEMKSPNNWLLDLWIDAERGNDAGRGELEALGSVHSNLLYYEELMNSVEQSKSKKRVESNQGIDLRSSRSKSSQIVLDKPFNPSENMLFFTLLRDPLQPQPLAE